MSGVSCRVFEFFERGAVAYGYSLEELVDGVDVDLAVLREPANRVPWPVWSAICERFEQLVGGPETTLEAGRTIIDLDASHPMRAMGGALVNPDLVYVAVARWLGPYFFRSLEWQVEQVQPGHVILEINMPEPVSPAWWRMAEGSFIALPQAFGAKPAQVGVRIDGGVGRFEIRREASTTLWARTVARVRAAFAAPSLLEELSVMQADLRSALVEANDSQREMHRALSAVPDPVAVMKGREAIWRNDAWLRTVGVDTPNSVHDAVETCTISGECGDGCSFQLGDGMIFEVVPPVEISYEGVPASMVMLRDVTHSRAAGERMRVADRLASLGTLAASVGHEINNPLQVALGSLDLAERTLDGSDNEPALRQHLASATDGIKRAAAITSDLLAFGREDATSDVLQMGSVVDTALRLAGNELRHIGNIKVDVDPKLSRVRGNAGSLIQVIVNLLINAAQAMRECPDRDHCIEIEGVEHDDEVRIQIRDTGPGIPAELLLRIREPFFTTKGQGGSGLGLAICDRIMEDHGGSMEVSNRQEGGAQFELRLPISSRQAPPEISAPASATALDPSRRILLVDDEAMIATLIQAQLAPCEVVACQNEAAAIEAIRGNGHFDAVLLDVMLLDGNGLDIARRLPEGLRERVVFMTGGVFQGEVLAELSDLSNPVLPKPFTRDNLLEVLGRVTS